MSSLAESRRRRNERRLLREAFAAPDRLRSDLTRLLYDLLDATGAERAALAWARVGAAETLVPFVVADAVSEPARRDLGALTVFGTEDAPPTRTIPIRFGKGPGFAVPLGSDGMRHWILLASAPPPPSGTAEGEQILFIAGQITAAVMHRDELRGEGTPGVLADIEQAPRTPAELKRFALRMSVANLLAQYQRDDFSMSADVRRTLAALAREDILHQSGTAHRDEKRYWGRVVNAFEDGDLPTLATVVTEWGEFVEHNGHLLSAVEIYRTAFTVAALLEMAPAAVDAARFMGRCLRRLSRSEESLHWYGHAQAIARIARHDAGSMLVNDGIINVYRERGNIPAARQALEVSFELAQSMGAEQKVVALMSAIAIEHSAGELQAARQYGLEAIRIVEHPAQRVEVMAVFAGLLQDSGEFQAAEDAWRIVLAETDIAYYRVYALGALAYFAALTQSRPSFESLSHQLDAAGWESGATMATAEIMLLRGKSYFALGDRETAIEWADRAVAFATTAKLHQVAFEAEAVKNSFVEETAPKPVDSSAAPASETDFQIRTDLRQMRAHLVGA